MYVKVHHKVGDFAKWKQLFDSDQESIMKAGFKKYGLYRTKEDPNDLIVFLEVTDEIKAKEFISSDAMKSKMKEGTVIGEPEVVFLELIEKKTLGVEEKAA